MERIGFIGLGNMGHPMAKNLEKAGLPLSVYNRTATKAEDFKMKSTIYSSIKELIENCDIIFTMLTNDDATKAVYKQVLGLSVVGKLFVDMSTISQEASIEISKAIR